MAEDRSKHGMRGGYHRTSRILNRQVNLLLACVLLLLTLPVFAVLYLVIFFWDGLPVFYRGVRLGLQKKPFVMFKFRTLARDAEDLIGAQLLTAGHRLMTPFGKFLRDTRLDELPQLLNIVKGEMDFVGPRPERPIVYEKMCRGIPNFDRRFEVKPGLIGFAQLFTPHSTPKKIRAMIDNTLVRKKQELLWDAGVIKLAAAMVVKATVRQSWRYFYRYVWMARVRRRFGREQRVYERVPQQEGGIRFGPAPNGEPWLECRASLVDINDMAFLMRCPERIAPPFPTEFQLFTRVKRRGRHARRKTVRCTGTLYRESSRDGRSYEYVIEYQPDTPLNYYKVHQYFLNRSVA